jgi:hypothetical protein
MRKYNFSVTLGLCASCVHAKQTSNDRGSVFLFCLKSKTDPSFPKYPRLPVLQCAGYQCRTKTTATDS